MSPFAFLEGYKTYISAAGLFGLAIFQFTQGQIAPGLQSLMAALAAVGLRSAIKKLE